MSDLYHTIRHEGSFQHKEKMSRFLGFAFPVTDAEDAKRHIKKLQNDYHDARHVCWAYMIGPQRKEWQVNDNGEPSGTAGKPILGQINSLDVTNIVVGVVRYFGGIKLGTSGLAEAYRVAARGAIEAGEVIECHDMTEVKVIFPYVAADGVLKIVKAENLQVIDRTFDNTCSVTLCLRKDHADGIVSRMTNIDGVTVSE